MSMVGSKGDPVSSFSPQAPNLAFSCPRFQHLPMALTPRGCPDFGRKRSAMEGVDVPPDRQRDLLPGIRMAQLASLSTLPSSWSNPIQVSDSHAKPWSVRKRTRCATSPSSAASYPARRHRDGYFPPLSSLSTKTSSPSPES